MGSWTSHVIASLAIFVTANPGFASAPEGLHAFPPSDMSIRAAQTRRSVAIDGRIDGNAPNRRPATSEYAPYFGIMSKVSGLGPYRPSSPWSSAAMRATSASSSSKSNRAMFSFMRALLFVLGKITSPR